MFLIGFPLLIIPLAIYNMIVFLTPGVQWTDQMTKVRMLSGAEWPVSFDDMLVMVSLFLLLVEIVKATRADGKSMIDHLLSFLVFAIAAGELLLVNQAANSTFVTVTAICLLDFLGGFAASRRAARPVRVVEKAEPGAPGAAAG